jgi:cell division protein FtsB
MARMKTSHKIALAGGGLLMLALVGLILIGEGGYIDYCRLKVQKETLMIKNNAAEEENFFLRRQVSRLETDQHYIEHIARKELGMIARDEIVYKFKLQGEAP